MTSTSTTSDTSRTTPAAAGFGTRFTTAARDALLVGSWRPCPPVEDRSSWSRIAEADRSTLLEAARSWKQEADHDPVSLSLWARYSTEGDRTPYEAAQRALLGSVASAALALGVTDDDHWAQVLGDQIWRLCELSAWCLPSHYALPESGERPFLPVPGRDVLDLSDAYIGGMLASIDAFAGDRLERVFPGLRARVHAEITRRVLVPWRDEVYFWHGVESVPNNWAPWIVSNVLVCSAVVERDRAELEASIERGLAVLDRFRAGYAEDGSCDEGATYWWWAGATLFEALDLVEELTDGLVDGFTVAPVAAMSRFPMAMQVSAETQVNFSDGSPALPPNASWHLLARFGERVGDAAVVEHARWMGRARPLGFSGQLAPLFRRTLAELHAPGWSSLGAAVPGMGASWYAPGTEVAVSREFAHRVDGWVVAAKGGHNDVSHNHNDAGGVIVSLDGAPVLIDVGVGVYYRRTFEPATRYTIWTMRSAWHSVPLPGGVEQQPGEHFRATEVVYSDDDGSAVLEMGLAGAYPAEALLVDARRRVELDRAGSRVVIADAWVFGEARVMTLVVMTALAPDPVPGSAGTLRIGDAVLRFDAEAFEAVIERVDLDDARLERAWGDSVYRTRLVQRTASPTGSHTTVLERAARSTTVEEDA